MKPLFHFLFLAFFAAAGLLLAACSDKKEAPAPTTGTVNGQITPADAVTAVTATSTATPATTATATPNASGAYSFTTLAAGTYTLSFAPATGYAAPAPQTVTVAAGGTVVATPVTATTSGGSGGGGGNSFAYTINGVATVANLVSTNVFSSSLLIQSSSNSGSRNITLSLDGLPTGPRTYTFGGAGSTSEIVVSELVGTSLLEWNTTVAGGSGTVTVTAVGTNPRRVSGTFSCVAQPRSAATGTKTITSGTFANLAF